MKKTLGRLALSGALLTSGCGEIGAGDQKQVEIGHVVDQMVERCKAAVSHNEEYVVCPIVTEDGHEGYIQLGCKFAPRPGQLRCLETTSSTLCGYQHNNFSCREAFDTSGNDCASYDDKDLIVAPDVSLEATNFRKHPRGEYDCSMIFAQF